MDLNTQDERGPRADELRARGLAAYEAGDLELSEQLLREALALRPGAANVIHILSAVLLGQGRFQEARKLAERVHSTYPADPFGRLILGKLRLATGDYADGWPLYDARLEFSGYATEVPPYAPWRGEDLRGKTIVVWREQGFGDMIMCLRFLPMLRELGARVIAVTRPALVRLYKSLGIETVSHGGAPGSLVELPAAPDFHTHPFSIPRWLGVTLDTVPGAPYLRAEPLVRGRIGVAWRGRPAHQYDRHRSLPAALGAQLLDLPGAVDLEPAATGAGDFLDTARIITGLDAVVTVDTSIAHLAGAIGRPTLLLLPRLGLDFRWMNDRADTPWYAATQLLRQQPGEDWGAVVARAVRALG